MTTCRTSFVILLIAILLTGCQSQVEPTPAEAGPTESAAGPAPTIIQALATATPTATTEAPPDTPAPSPTPTATETPPPIHTATPVLLPTETPLPTDTPAPTPTSEPEPPATEAVVSCEPTQPDAEGPFYVPNAPERTSVGQGFSLSGVVRSSVDCVPLPTAQIEVWLAGPDGAYGDAYRATLFAGEAGAYQFESHVPPPYSGRPPHLHLRVTAAGHQPLVTQYYPAPGETEGTFDLVLLPEAEGTAGSASPEPSGSVVTTNLGPEVPDPTLFDTIWKDREIFRAGLIESAQDVLDQLPGASVYHIDVQIAETLTDISGQQEVLYTNQEDVPLDDIYLRLFPNLASGSTTIANLTVNGQAVEPLFELQNSAMRVPLPTPLQPGEAVVLRLDFGVRVPNGKGGNYGTFAYLDDVLALAHFYPMIAVYDDEGWNVEIAPSIGDVVYADMSFYRVRVSAPAAQTVVASGIEIERQEAEGRQTITYAAGPMRDFYLAASNRYDVVSSTVGQVTVNSYAPTDLMEGADAALEQTINALNSFNERFGPYPYTEFDLVTTTTFALGIEYPGIVALLVDLYDVDGSLGGTPNTILLESVVAHEVAHQWFYNMVGNDQVDDPWLDEALAQFLTVIYYSDVYGPTGSQGFRNSLQRRWSRIDSAQIPIGRPVRDYSPEAYSAIIYGRGPLFIEALSQEMGAENFAAFLRRYYQTYQWQIATGEDFKALAEAECGCDLTPLFEQWVY